MAAAGTSSARAGATAAEQIPAAQLGACTGVKGTRAGAFAIHSFRASNHSFTLE
jgi:hypothetical protein